MKKLVITMLFGIMPIFLFAQITGKTWKIESIVMVGSLRTIQIFSRTSPQILEPNILTFQVEFFTDGTFRAIDVDGVSNLGVWHLIPPNSIKIDDDILLFEVKSNARISYTGVVQTTDENGELIQGNIVTVLSSEDALPVVLSSFIAKKLDDKKVLLLWETISEIKSDHFVVEYSSNAKNFKSIGKVQAQSAEQTYSFNHYLDSNGPGNYYYRLKMVDKDGSFALSSIQRVTIIDGITKVFPNPATDEIVIEAPNWKDLKSVSILDITGQEMFKSVSTPTRVISVKHFSPGTYVLITEYESGQNNGVKFIKN